ncbi:MAG: MFS transporter [Verrucomicrobia bacterium]|nr:MFS transporter [Verrucomicrobiota bacterium]
MSTLVVVRKGNQAVIGSDSQFMQGSIIVSARNRTNHHKIHHFKDAYVGFTGWSLMHNIFADIIEKYPGDLDFSSVKHIFKTFLFLHEKIKSDYFVQSREKDDQPVESSQWDCLIASPHGIFAVDSYRTVVEYERFWADGSGTRFALGAMHSVYDTRQDAEEIAKAGLEAACAFDDGSGLPIAVQSVPLGKRKSG